VTLPRQASRHALSLLRFPDRRTGWVVVLVVTAREAQTVSLISERLTALHAAVPMVGARLAGEIWNPGEPDDVLVTDREPLEDERLDATFRLDSAAPLRVMLGGGGRRLGVAGHHAAFDGLGLLAIVDSLLGSEFPAPVDSPPPGQRSTHVAFARRLLTPADRVAASVRKPARDSYATREIVVSGRSITARLAQACVAAAGSHNARLGSRWSTVGISVAKGGPAGVGNVASYRRVDLLAGAPVVARIEAALASPYEPREQVRTGIALTLARPIVYRLSDSLLVSNLGRQRLPGAERIDFFPVARGRSAVAFGAATVADGASTFALRARDLSQSDADRLLSEAVERLQPAQEHTR
jgi:hypothetical protein